MSGLGKAAADEDQIVANPENNEDTDVLNNSDADTEPAMLEEEEMPTYMSLTSSSRPDESRVELDPQQPPKDTSQRGEGRENRASSPYASDPGGGSIYVVSSGEESDGAYDNDDIESGEMELEDEEEEDDEDDSQPAYNDDEEDSKGDIEPEQFERSSDDFVLKYDTGLEKQNKVRSRSLQDLTNSRGNLSRFVGKRRSVDIMGHFNARLARHEREHLRDSLSEDKKPVRSSRYSHVPSKVKLYIESIKEQSRLSAELKHRENPVHRIFNESRSENADVSCSRINPTNKIIKEYAQNVINTVTNQDHSTVPEVTYGGRCLSENEPDRRPIVLLESKQSMNKDTGLEVLVPDDQTNMVNNVCKITTSNGIIDYSTQNHSQKVVEPMENCTANGQEQIATIFNLRTLSYEEYANGDQASNNKTEIDEMRPILEEEKNGVTKFMEEEEILGISQTETARVPASVKTENVKVTQVPEEAEAVREISEFPKSASHEVAPTNRENADVSMLWAMLNQKSAQFNEKTAQYDGIRGAFQKTLTENISLKRELEDLKQTLAQCRSENKPRETKVASVQTDSFSEVEEPEVSTNELKTSSNELKPPMPKLLSSSIGSALSSIEQWSDSNCSPAISINPPNMDYVLNSDDSFPERTPRRQTRPLSHSFVTSSKILQTLAKITQGRTKTASPLTSATNVNSHLEAGKGQTERESNSPMTSGNEVNAARVRKRKASDMLGFSSYAEPFKMPHTSDVPRKNVNSNSDTDGVLKSPREKSRTGSINRLSPGGSKDDVNAGRHDDFGDSETIDVPENVKCFVYQEEDNSKERSFLIQAEEPSKSSDVGEKEGGPIRECGPYLLGNVEIRMSEANGTINIWGKEVSQEIDYMDVEVEVEDASLVGQKTPRANFVNVSSPFVCSTNKKSKVSPQFIRSSIGKYFRPVLQNLSKVNTLTNEGEGGRCVSCPVLDNRTLGCERRESQKLRHFHWPNCDHFTNSQRKHSYCRHEVDVNEKNCDYGDLEDATILESMSNVLSSHKKCTTALHNLSTKHSCLNRVSEKTYRHQTPRHPRSSENEEDCHHVKQRCPSCSSELPSCNTRLTPRNVGCCNNRSRSHSYPSSCDDEEHLLQNGQHYETPETKRRRLSGKKVRGILTDLLRSCGGCRDHSSGASFVAKESMGLPNVNPTVRVTPCIPPQPLCSRSASHSKCSPPRNPSNEKCCRSCFRRVEMAAEIESKLELLTVEMERLRSRSDTFRGMLDLLNAETD